MFDKGRVLREGAQANAVVLDADVTATGGQQGQLPHPIRTHYKLRVPFEDGTSIAVAAFGKGQDLAKFVEGDTVPVRYDPADRSKVYLDAPAIEADSPIGRLQRRNEMNKALSSARASGDQAEVDRLQAELRNLRLHPGASAGGAAAGGSGDAGVDPLERLQKLADLHAHGVLTAAEFEAQKAKILGES